MPAELALLFTGTGSAIPSKYRNVTGILCLPPPPATPLPAGNPYLAHCVRANVLFDCGEGTLGQLFRALGAGEGEAGSGPAMGAASGSGPLQSLPLAASLEEALAGLALLSISHLHADHHLGLASLVAARARPWMRAT
jgi:ribonuclease Z